MIKVFDEIREGPNGLEVKVSQAAVDKAKKTVKWMIAHHCLWSYFCAGWLWYNVFFTGSRFWIIAWTILEVSHTLQAVHRWRHQSSLEFSQLLKMAAKDKELAARTIEYAQKQRKND